MHLTIRNLPAKFSLPVIRDASEFYAQRLLGPRLARSVSVRIVFVKGLHKTKGCLAMCTWEDDNHRPREFSIMMDSRMGEKTMMATLAHEMIHVKQYAKGELKDMLSAFFVSRFHGKLYNSDVIEYMKLPWEVEAFNNEAQLYLELKEYQKKK
jgi:hypothetical protein